MVTCYFCDKTIETGDKIKIISGDTTLLSENGDYSLVDGFFKDQRIIHYNCLGKKEVKTKDHSTDINFIIQKRLISFKNTLTSLGESVTRQDIINFLVKHKDTDDPTELLKIWFTNRNKLSD